MPTLRLVLASASPARARLLESAGFAFDVVVSGVDEDGIERPTTAALVSDLARMKADAVAAALGPGAGTVVVACDSMLDVDGRAVGKPASRDDAFSFLASMRGRTGTLMTGHCVADLGSGRRAEAVGSTTVCFATTTDDELAAYLATGEADGVAGSFTIDGRSAPFVAGVDGDPSNVIGLSLPLLRDLLGELGHTVMECWT